MQLQKQLSRKHKNKIYSKYIIVIPPKIIKKLKWKEGDKLDCIISGEKLIIRKLKE